MPSVLGVILDLSWMVMVGLVASAGVILLCRRRKLLGGLLLWVATVLVVGPILPDLDWGTAREARDRNACIANLKQMAGARDAWAEAMKRTSTDIPQDSDLFGPGKYIPEKPVCPAGGSYSWTPVNCRPACGLAAHEHQ